MYMCVLCIYVYVYMYVRCFDFPDIFIEDAILELNSWAEIDT